MRIRNRTSLVAAYCSRGRNFPISILEVVRRGLLESTCEQIGHQYILSIIDGGLLEEVSLRNIPDPLFWPKLLPHRELYKACGDCLWPSHWHHYEVPETKVEFGESVLDCGAAEGLFSLSVAQRAGKLALFEPWLGFHASLEATFGQRAILCSQALGKTRRTAYLSGSSLYGAVSDAGETGISVTTIDDFRQNFGQVNYIKADVEGSEYDLLEGARETIFTDRPKIAITTYHIGNDWEQMLKLVRAAVPQYKYRIKGISYNGGQTRPVMLHLWA